MPEPPHGRSPARRVGSYVCRCVVCHVQWAVRSPDVDLDMESCHFCGAGSEAVRFKYEGVAKRSVTHSRPPYN